MSRKIATFSILILLFTLSVIEVVSARSPSLLVSIKENIKPGVPKILRIEKLGIDTAIQGVGLNSKGEMGIIDSAEDVAWYRNGPKPGEAGSSIINGHFDTKQVERAVFHDLEKLKKGDIVEVVDDRSQVFRFKVVDKKTYDYDDTDPEVFKFSSKKHLLNLISCTGEWLPEHKVYDKRIVVFTELVEK